jgi:hypothetical protein
MYQRNKGSIRRLFQFELGRAHLRFDDFAASVAIIGR